MADAALEGLWKAVRRDLDRARTLLPSPLAELAGSSVRLAEWLSHNELELALDELEALGVDNAAGSLFWSQLHSAATRMGLIGHADRLGRNALSDPGPGVIVDGAGV